MLQNRVVCVKTKPDSFTTRIQRSKIESVNERYDIFRYIKSLFLK